MTRSRVFGGRKISEDAGRGQKTEGVGVVYLGRRQMDSKWIGQLGQLGSIKWTSVSLEERIALHYIALKCIDVELSVLNTFSSFFLYFCAVFHVE